MRDRLEFIQALQQRPAEGQWGLFAMNFPGRTGQQCEDYFGKLAAYGDLSGFDIPDLKSAAAARKQQQEEAEARKKRGKGKKDTRGDGTDEEDDADADEDEDGSDDDEEEDDDDDAEGDDKTNGSAPQQPPQARGHMSQSLMAPSKLNIHHRLFSPALKQNLALFEYQRDFCILNQTKM